MPDSDAPVEGAPVAGDPPPRPVRKPAKPPEPWYQRLHWQIFIALALGLIVGLIARGGWGEAGAEAVVTYVGWLGTLFVKLLKMIIVPLVLTSIISGIASVGSGSSLGRLFSKTMGYYLLSSLAAILVGLLLVNLIQPGVGADFGGAKSQELPELSTATSPKALLLDIVPENFIAAAAKPDMLSLIFFAIVLAISIAALPEGPQGRLTRFFEDAFEAMMKLTGGVIRFAPIGVFGLIAAAASTLDIGAARAVGLYMLTIAGALLIHLLLTLPLFLRFLGKINPIIHFKNMAEPLAMAFSTSSSGATLPVTMRAVEDRAKVSNKVTSFVLPMGATVNMDGTALYECAGVLFIAQAIGFDLSLGQQALVVVTALLASIGAAAVPSAGLVIIFLVLQAVGLVGEEVNYIVGIMLAVDRPLDMLRTAVNVFSDSCGAAIIARSEGETEVDLEVVPTEDEEWE